MGLDRGVWGERGLDGELALTIMMSMSRQALRRLAKAEYGAEWGGIGLDGARWDLMGRDWDEWGWRGRDGDGVWSEQSMG